jgi:hypothetical protein
MSLPHTFDMSDGLRMEYPAIAERNDLAGVTVRWSMLIPRVTFSTRPGTRNIRKLSKKT